MANVKITELVELAAGDISGNDVLPIVDVGADATKKVTIVKLRLIIGKEEYWGQGEANVTVQSTFLDLNDDNLPFNKTAFSGAVKKALVEAVGEM